MIAKKKRAAIKEIAQPIVNPTSTCREATNEGPGMEKNEGVNFT